MIRTLLAACAVSMSFVGAASAATLSGSFTVQAVNVKNVSGSESQALFTDMLDAANGVNGDDPVFDEFNYTGSIDFGTFDGTDGTTVEGWLATGGGIVSGLDAALAGRQLSKPKIGKGTATTTFFLFKMIVPDAITTLDITHDDGIGVYDDAMLIGGFSNPTGVRNTKVNGFDGGVLSFVYVATNGDPSVLHVAAVPLPASVSLMLAGLGGLAIARRRVRA